MKRHDVDYRIVESLGAFMKNLNDVSRNGALVVVEGKRDAEALKALGFEGPLLTISHRAKFATLAQEAEKFEKTILLLDFDVKGRVLTKRAALLLQEKKNVIDLYFRKQLAFITRGKLKHVENLIRYKDYVKDYVKGFATY